MLTRQQLREHLTDMGLPDKGIAKALYTFDNPQVRDPECHGNRDNVVVLYPSTTNGIVQKLDVV